MWATRISFLLELPEVPHFINSFPLGTARNLLLMQSFSPSQGEIYFVVLTCYDHLRILLRMYGVALCCK